MTFSLLVESLVEGCMTVVVDVLVGSVFLYISYGGPDNADDLPPAQTLRSVVISTRCSVASRDPSSRVWNANNLEISSTDYCEIAAS